MELSSKFDPAQYEDKWYSYWMEQGYFYSTPDDRPSYTITIPPPNVTGVLHMGHMLNNTLQDVLIRRARMLGFNACWVPGTDHASIATEAKVVAKLKSEGIEKHDLTRDEFLKHAWEWKEKHGGIIFEQLKKLGASLDWNRSRFTMEPSLSKAVIDTFVDLHNKGYIYRGYRMVNWDSEALTAVSDEEVYHQEVASKLYHVRYRVEGTEDEWLTIATTRPETILGDSAICVNPNDDRYKHLAGKRAIVPFVNRSIPVIFDEYVTMEFGTGCLKVTPAHDPNDYELGKKHDLEFIDILNADGTLSEAAQRYIGEDRFVVRKKIAKDLDAEGHLVKVEEYQNKVGYSERTNAVIEPRVSVQWFLKMKELSKPALEHVMDDTIQLVPAKFKNTYRHWMENVHDWCISRQLWWGHRIPAWYYGSGNTEYVVAATAEEALQLAKEKSGNADLSEDQLRQDEDVLDTWFSSWLWPISVFDGMEDPNNADINYYYPTNVLVTAPEILFFWVARMIIAGYEYRGQKPFESVYLTGIVRDPQGRKMSKQLGNSPDPIGLIEKYGADGVRVGMLLSSPAGNDLLFDEKLCVQGSSFSNKVWNANRLVSSWVEDSSLEQPKENALANLWFESLFNQELKTLGDHYDKFRISDALMVTYKLVWDEFCGWYLEMIKPGMDKKIDSLTMKQVRGHFENVLKIMHPFMPFISEELWHQIEARDAQNSLIVSSWPEGGEVNADLIADIEKVKTIISEVRKFRKDNKVANKNELELQKATKNDGFNVLEFSDVLAKMGNLSNVSEVAEDPAGAHSFLIGSERFFIPAEGLFDVEGQMQKLKSELEYAQGFLASVDKKLSNERFVNNAPAQVVDGEKKKKADAEAKIKVLEEQLANLAG